MAVLLTAFVIAPAIVYAQSVTATWDPSPPSENVTSYDVCIGSSAGSCNVQTASVPGGQVTFPFAPAGGVMHYVAIRAINASGTGPYSSPIGFSIPSFAQPPNQISQVGLAIPALTLSVSDPDGSPLTFTHTGLPVGLSINSSTRQIIGTPTAAGTHNVTVFVADGLETVSRSFTWTVNPPALVTADSSFPNTGSGASQLFTFQYSDTIGAADLTQSWVWITASFGSSAANSCMLYYDRTDARLYLLGNNGTTWTPGVLGTAATLQNAQCAVALASSSVSLSGNTLTLNLATTFFSSYAGAKSTYLYARNAPGANSGWQVRGNWTVSGGASSPSVSAVSVTPSSGSGATRAFAMQYSDSAGATDLSQAWVWFNATLAANGANSCMLYYDRPTARLYLLNDSAGSWMQGTLGTSTTLQNAQCAVALASSSVSLSGNTLTLNLSMTFTTSFAGGKNVYLYARNAGGINSGWQDLGDWTVPSTTGPGVNAVSATPSSGSGFTQTFALQYSDSTGAANLTQAWAWFTASFGSTAANSCMMYYDRPSATLYLLNENGTAWMPGTLGTSVTIANERCRVNLATSSVSLSGNTLTLNVAMTFTSNYSGAKNTYLYAKNASGLNSGWQDRGDWIVP